MSDVMDNMRALVREAAWPAEPGEPVKAAIRRAARRLGLSFARTHGYWYGRARSVPAEEWVAVQDARLRLRRERAARLRAELAALEGHDGAIPQGVRGSVPVDRGPLA
jgi:hypothetical protein